MGALARGYQTGGYVDPEDEEDDGTDDPYADPYGDGSGDNGYYDGSDAAPQDDTYGSDAPAGALSTPSHNPLIDQYNQLGEALTGPTADIPGALSQRRQNKDAAYAQKQAAIQRAMDILRASGQGRQNLPQEAYYAAFARPTWGGPGAHIANANDAYAKAVDAQREDAYRRATAEGTLGVSGAQAGIDRANSDENDYLRQLGLGERAKQNATRIQSYDNAIAARARRDQLLAAATEQRRADAAAAAQQKAEAFNKWIGTDPETGNPIFQNALGQTKIGEKPINAKPSARGTGGGKGGTALQQNIEALVRFGIAKDEKDAFAKLKTSASIPQAHNNLVMRMVEQINKGSIIPRSLQEVLPEAEAAVRQMESSTAEKSPPQPVPNSPIARSRTSWDKAAPAGASDTPPPQVLQTLREGVKTTFASGQQWTLQNGKPVRLK